MSKIMLLLPSQVGIDPRVQRQLDESRAEKIGREFNENGFGVPSISKRDDGTFVVIDGQHRLAGARLASLGDHAFEMKVFEGLSLQEEAELFRLLNTTKPPSPVDGFKIALIERRPEEVSIARIIGDYGWKVDNGGRRGSVQAVSALRTVYRKDSDRHGLSTGTTLGSTTKTLTAAWGLGVNSLASSLLLGVGALIWRHSATVDQDLLIKALEFGWAKPDNLITQGRSYKDASGTSVQDAIATVVTNAYNKRARSAAKKVPEWTSGRVAKVSEVPAAEFSDAAE